MGIQSHASPYQYTMVTFGKFLKNAFSLTYSNKNHMQKAFLVCMEVQELSNSLFSIRIIAWILPAFTYSKISSKFCWITFTYYEHPTGELSCHQMQLLLTQHVWGPSITDPHYQCAPSVQRLLLFPATKITHLPIHNIGFRQELDMTHCSQQKPNIPTNSPNEVNHNRKMKDRSKENL